MNMITANYGGDLVMEVEVRGRVEHRKVKCVKVEAPQVGAYKVRSHLYEMLQPITSFGEMLKMENGRYVID